MSHVDRRTFVRTAAAAGVGVTVDARSIAAGPMPMRPPPGAIQTVRVGFVGVGQHGSSHVRNLLSIPGVEIRAICDIVPAKVAAMQDLVAESGAARPAAYATDPEGYRRMCEEEELDLVFNATPWELHAPVMLAAMRAGKHGAT